MSFSGTMNLVAAVILVSSVGPLFAVQPGAEKPESTPSTSSLLLAEPKRADWTPSPVVQAEQAEVEARFPALEPLTRLPDFLAVNDVLALARSDDREQLRRAIHEQLDRRDGETLRGGYLEEPPTEGPDRRTYVLWIHDHLDQILVLFDGRGRVALRRAFYRAVPRRAEVHALARERSDERTRHSLIIERIATTSVCCLSVRWDVYRVTDRHGLVRVADVPKSHYDVGPGVQYTYLNHVEFEKDRMVLTRIYPQAEPDVVREPYVLPYRPEHRKFVPSASTARRLAADHRDPHDLDD